MHHLGHLSSDVRGLRSFNAGAGPIALPAASGSTAATTFKADFEHSVGNRPTTLALPQPAPWLNGGTSRLQRNASFLAAARCGPSKASPATPAGPTPAGNKPVNAAPSAQEGQEGQGSADHSEEKSRVTGEAGVDLLDAAKSMPAVAKPDVSGSGKLSQPAAPLSARDAKPRSQDKAAAEGSSAEVPFHAGSGRIALAPLPAPVEALAVAAPVLLAAPLMATPASIAGRKHPAVQGAVAIKAASAQPVSRPGAPPATIRPVETGVAAATAAPPLSGGEAKEPAASATVTSTGPVTSTVASSKNTRTEAPKDPLKGGVTQDSAAPGTTIAAAEVAGSLSLPGTQPGSQPHATGGLQPVSGQNMIEATTGPAVNPLHVGTAKSASSPATFPVAAAGSVPMEEVKTLVATPKVLEVGVPGGSHGWLRVRAELGDAGEVSTSLVTQTVDLADGLHKELPAISAYLEGEHVGVSSLVVNAPEQGSGAQDALVAGQGAMQGDGRPSRQEPAPQPKSESAPGGFNAAQIGSAESVSFSSLPAAVFTGANGSWVNVVV